MSTFEFWSLLIQALTAIFLLGIIVVVIFGSHIRHMLYPAIADIEILDKNGERTILDNGHRVVYYHIRVINRGKVVIKNCRAVLKKIKRLQNAEFIDVPFSVPPRYIWSPSETSPEGVDIISERIADFGYVIDSSTEFKPTVTPILNSFRGNLKHNETFRYYIEIIAENYKARKLVAIEVTWDGVWPADLNEMHRHLKIQKI
jgi:hypothetical protein